ncbi:MAG: hypothetical protein QOD93_4759 [Acetobacteraceae bacterium]|nr:hypothetical protein [Acetobacteraceae bacterium]MEA2771797.1 hypothetical protein [Acetobacteraceae bacterium]
MEFGQAAFTAGDPAVAEAHFRQPALFDWSWVIGAVNDALTALRE